MQVVWSKFAEHKLDELYLYLNFEYSKKIAKTVIQEIVEKTLLLSQNPRLGPKETLMLTNQHELRYIIVGKHKIIYKVNDINKRIEILTVFDTRQNPTSLENEI